MKRNKEVVPRSGCPISFSLDFLGDKWTLLILRDMMFSGKSSYGEFLNSGEGIATNILADRLNLLEANGFVTKNVSADNKSKFIYNLTEKGINVLPIVIELMIWGAKFSPAGGNQELLKVLKSDKEKTIKEFSKMLRKRIVSK